MTNELWGDEKIALLKELWDRNLTGLQISEIMAEKKMPSPTNAIYKKAKRLGLSPRVSPIFVKTEKKELKEPKPPKQEVISNPIIPKPVSSPFPVKLTPEPDKTLVIKTYEYDKSMGCCWPIGDPKKPGFRFCGENRVGRNYCSKHEKRAFVRP